MLLYATGSSCSGKSTLAGGLERELLVVRDTDERGVPSDADTAWRQLELETWVIEAIALEASGADLLLTGQSPLGELLAVPSAPRLSALAVCLVDVADDERIARLRARDPGMPDAEGGALLGWAGWHRRHAADPTAAPEVITDPGAPGMRWERWSPWRRGDPRWRTEILDTTGRTEDACRRDLAAWVDARRRSDPADANQSLRVR